MKSTAWMLMLIVLILVRVHAGDTGDKDACEQVKKRIRVIESRMREGYSAAQGIRYEARLRELKEKRYKLCR